MTRTGTGPCSDKTSPWGFQCTICFSHELYPPNTACSSFASRPLIGMKLSAFAASFILSIGVHIGGAVQCSLESVSTIVTPSFNAATTLSVSLANAPTTGYCSLDLSTYNGIVVTGVHQRGSCNGFTPTDLAKSSLPSPTSLVYGLALTFTLNVYSDSGYTILTCSSSGSVTPARCRSASSDLAMLALSKQPYGYIRASVPNQPLIGECVYTITEWNGAPTTSAVDSTDCSPKLLRPSAVTLGTQSAVGLVVFAANSDHATAQPLCGINPVTITPPVCDATVAAADTSLTTIGVAIRGAQPGVRCTVYLVTWNDNDKKSMALQRSSGDCSSVTFGAADVGEDLVYGSGVYSFEYAEFAAGQTIPACSVDAASFSFTQDTCSNTTILPVRPDPYSVSITLDPVLVKPYGQCRVRMVKYAGSAVSLARVGPCSGRFDFISDGGSIALADGSTAEFAYDFFGNGDVSNSIPTCTTSSTRVYTMQFTCPTAPATLIDNIDSYTMILPYPQPLVGDCVFLGICHGFTGEKRLFSSCTSSAQILYSDLTDVVQFQGLADEDVFQWTYYSPNGTRLCDGSVVTPSFIFIWVDAQMNLESTGPGSVTLSPGEIPAQAPLYSGMGCQFILISCNGIGPTRVTAQTIPSCTLGHTVTFTDEVDIPVGANCIFEMGVYVGDNLGVNIARSHWMSVVAAGVPSWGSDQTPSLQLSGDSCIAVSWPIPATSGGIPTDCYEVQRKFGTGGTYSVVAPCVAALSLQLCDFALSLTVPFTVQVFAINRAGESLTAIESRTTTFLAELADANTDYVSPSSSITQFAAVGFPLFVVRESDTSAPTTGRLYVGRLLSRCKLDADSSTIAVPLAPSDTDYTSVALPIAPNSPPAFTRVLTPVDGSAGYYSLGVNDTIAAGAYSLAVHSLESGGLLGQYWTNAVFSGSPAVIRKDTGINFAWGNQPIVLLATNQVSVRWTGFVEAMYSELYTIIVDLTDYVSVWIDDVQIINAWATPCAGECSGTVELRQSVSISRKFHYLRIDYMHTKGNAVFKPAGISVSWSSFSQPREMIPADHLFKAPIIQGAVRTVTLTAGIVSGPACTVTGPVENVTAGRSSEILITARDAAGNVILGSTDSFLATFTGGAGQPAFPSHPVDASKNDGLYSIPFVVSSAVTYTVEITATGSMSNLPQLSIQVSTGPPTIDSVTPVIGAAGAPSYIAVGLKDANLNTVGGTDVFPPLYASLTWVADSDAAARLTIDDVAVRTATYGTVFTSTSIVWNAQTHKYGIQVALPLAGTYSGYVGLDGDDASPPHDLDPVTVSATPVSVPRNAVVVTAPFPPTDLVVGQEATITLQLRDEFKNAITTSLDGPTPSIDIKLSGPSGITSGSCSVVSDPLGQAVCTLTPTSAGSGQALSVLVEGVLVSYLSSVGGGPVQRVPGPWLVDAAPGQISAADSLLVGVRSVYMVGLRAEVTLVLRDAGQNPVGPLDVYPTVEVHFLNDGIAEQFMDPATFVYNPDGSIKIPIVLTIAGSPIIFTVNVNGEPVPMPYGIDGTAISVYPGQVSTIGTVCTNWPSSARAGALGAATCTPADVGGNALTLPHLYTYAYFELKSDSTVSVRVDGVYNSGDHTFSYTADQVTHPGYYDFYTAIGRPGGLMGQYFTEPDFVSILPGLDGVQLSDRRLYEQPVQYTRIDPYLGFTLLGSWEWGDVPVLSARWIGMVMPPVSATYTFTVTAVGGIRVELPPGIAQVDDLDATDVTTTFSVSLTAYTAVEILIEYKPQSIQAGVTIQWEYAGAPVTGPHTVPPSAWLAVMAVSQSPIALTVIGPYNAEFSALSGLRSVYVVGYADNIELILQDAAGHAVGPLNAYPTISAYFTTDSDGTRMTMDPATFTYSAQDGSITIPILPTSDSGAGTFSLTVEANGEVVPAPAGVDSAHIVVMLPVLDATGTTCELWPSNPTANTPMSVHCTPGDAFGHHIVWPNMFVQSYFRDPNGGVTTVTGSPDGSDSSYLMDLSDGLSGVSWPYSVDTVLTVPGGLFAQYFDSTTSDITITDGGGPRPSPGGGDPESFIITRIDPTVVLTYIGGRDWADRGRPGAYKWTGFLLPPVTATSFTISVASMGPVGVKLGGSYVIYDWDWDMPNGGSYTFAPTPGEYIPIVVDYVPPVDTASIELRCDYTGGPSGGEVIPPSILFTLSWIGGQGRYVITVG